MKDTLLYLKFALEYALQNGTLSHMKQFRRWLRDKRSGDSTLRRELPWMTYDAIDLLESICEPDTTVFEWGSGGSTLFFSRRCSRVTTVEHDSKWSVLLADKLKRLSVNNVDFREVPGEVIVDWAERDFRDSDSFVSSDRNSVGLSFEKYVKTIDAYPDNYFDIIVVDGRSRNCCVKRAMAHLKQGGYLVVDNTDRRYYLSEFHLLQDPDLWRKTELQGPVFFQHAFSKTTFFEKL